MALIDKLSAIGDAIREKNGTTDLIPLGNMPAAIEAIQTGGELPEEAFVITGNCQYIFYNDNWTWFLETYGNLIQVKDVSQAMDMFNHYPLAKVPFEVSFIDNYNNSFQNFCYYAQFEEPPILNIKLKANYSNSFNNFFSNCYYLKSIPNDYFANLATPENWESIKQTTGSRTYMFHGCFSLRELPDISMLITKNTAYYGSFYYSLFQNCYTLNKIENIPIAINATYTSNMFSSTFNYTYRCNKITFATDNGAPYSVNWKAQTISLDSSVGSGGYVSNYTYYNSGITADKEVKDDATYQVLKNDPDWFSRYTAYSRYNHDSAVETINSLPDTSAYLATAGGTNTIKFEGAAGEKTDGGAINTLTEEEIAVATAKGWTVTLV